MTVHRIEHLLEEHFRFLLDSTPDMVALALALGDQHLADRYADLGLDAAEQLGLVSREARERSRD